MQDEQVREVVVTDRHVAAEGVVVLRLERTDGEPMPPWEPGAHVDLVDSVEQSRQYSLCGATDDRTAYQVAVLEEIEGRGFSRALHREATVGSTWSMRGPRRHFALEPSEEYLFVAGGIGITPILPMIAEAQRRGASWRLLYGGRTRGSMAFLDELAAYGERVEVVPQDERGLLPLAEWIDASEGVPVYCCGPGPLLDAVTERCGMRRSGSVHVEHFSPKEVGAPVRDEPFEVELRQSGVTFEVPVDRSILEMVGEAGIPTLSACQEGTCGTCETPVLEGIPDHRDSVLDEEERAANDYMMICISRSCGPRLVLDL